jgi:hypothetical protein
MSLKDQLVRLWKQHADIMSELKATVHVAEPVGTCSSLQGHIIASIRERIETLAAQQKLIDLGTELMGEFKDIFQPIVPPINRLPEDVMCRITLKDALKLVTTRSYSTAQKYEEM